MPLTLFYKVIVMNTPKRTAAAQLLLTFPAILFMGALVVRQFSPLQDEPARTAHSIVMWYAGRVWTLWVLLITLPLAGLVTGCVTLARNWRDDLELRQAAQQTLSAIHTDRATRSVAAMTLTAGVILAIVAMHMAAN
jgi:ABC-type Fe3+ transport system permease subunit